MASKFKLDDLDFEIESKEKVKYCKKCHTENKLESKFCFECGCKEFVSSLSKKTNEKYCIKCKTKLNKNDKFCYNCGCNEFVDTLDEVDNYFINEMNSKWESEYNKINKKIDKALMEIDELKIKKDEYINNISNLKTEWEDKINKLSSDKNVKSDKVNSYTNESSGYVKKISKLKEQIAKLEKEYNDKANKINKKEVKIEENKTIDISKFINNKSPLQIYNSALKLENDQEYDKSFLLYQEAANKGHALAQNKLGNIYFSGFIGTNFRTKICDIDYNLAIYWYELSASNGNYYAMCNLGKIYLEGTKGVSDIKKAINYFENSLKTKEHYKADAYYYLGKCYESFYYKDQTKCLYNYEKADNFESHKRLAFIYYEGVFGIKDNNTALKWALKAYGSGYYDPNGEVGNLLGKLYYGTTGIKQDNKKAFNYFEKSALNNNSIDSYYYLSLCYQHGHGVDIDKTKAKKYLEYAASKGHLLAKKQL